VTSLSPDRSPSERAYNHALERLVLPAGDLALRTEFIKELRRWRQVQRLSAPELANGQRAGLERLLRHASTEVPHYRDLRTTGSDDPYAWLRQFPILTKSHLRSEADRLITLGARNLVKIASSGSSGVQSVVWSTPREQSRSLAIQTLWWEWAGYRLGDRLLQTGITPDRGVVKLLKDRLLRTTYVVAFGLTDAEMADILEGGRQRPWRFLGGYASSLAALARVASTQEIGVSGVEAAISWGDKLYPRHRKLIGDHLGASVFDTYGASEGLMIAAQRTPTSPYYVMSPHVVVELLDEDDQPVAPGDLGRVIVTRLDGFSMPLIRFRLGDLAVAPETPLTVGGGPAFPQLERIIGRETDVIISPEGRTLTVHTFTGVFEHVESIEQFSVLPTQAGLVIEYIVGAGFDPSTLDEVGAALCRAVGEHLAITWRQVSHISDSPSGKPQIIRPVAGDS